jgi:hypothetical protein
VFQQFSLQLFSETIFAFINIWRATLKVHPDMHVQFPLFLLFLLKSKYVDKLQFNPPISNFKKVTSEVLELSHVDKRKDSHGEAALDLHKQIPFQSTLYWPFCAMITRTSGCPVP